MSTEHKCAFCNKAATVLVAPMGRKLGWQVCDEDACKLTQAAFTSASPIPEPDPTCKYRVVLQHPYDPKMITECTFCKKEAFVSYGPVKSCWDHHDLLMGHQEMACQHCVDRDQKTIIPKPALY